MMEAIHVLRDDTMNEVRILERRQRVVRRVRPSVRDPSPPDRATSPVPAPIHLRPHELAVLHRLAGLQAPLGPPVVRDTGLGAATGSGEDDGTPAFHQFEEVVDHAER
jgi:hypothetical protein